MNPKIDKLRSFLPLH